MPSFSTRLQNAWNAFFNKDPTQYNRDWGMGSAYRPDRPRLTRGNERSIVNSIYNRIAVDVAAISIEHVRLNENGQYKETIESTLNEILTLDANVDQTGPSLIMDAVMSMFDEGCVALMPVETDIKPRTESFDILTMRTARIVQWYPEYVRLKAYNDRTGLHEELMMPKRNVALIENPFYAIMNEPNSILQRLIRKLNLLDLVDEQSGSGKLDLIIQLPYVIKTQARRDQADQRRKDIEAQLRGSKYGIAYTDGTEKIIQLNRAVENNLWQEVKDLTDMLYNQLGLTTSIFDGTADEKTMLNYYNRTIEPILSAIALELQRKYLSKTARTQGQAIRFFRDPFKLVPVAELAEITDKFTRNEIASSNEMRSVIGWKPSDDPKADMLINSNLNQNLNGMGVEEPLPEEELPPEEYYEEYPEEARHSEELSEINLNKGDLKAFVEDKSNVKLKISSLRRKKQNGS